MSRRQRSRNASDDSDQARIDGKGLEWALTQVREWRTLVGNRAEIDGHLLARQMLRLAERGLQESLCGYVILGCEWMFRLRTSGPQDAQIVLARIEGRLLPFLGDEAWFVTEALAASIRKLLKHHRTLAGEWEDEPGRVVVTEPEAIGIGRVRDLRVPPAPSIPSRRGPAPKPAPWIAGLIIEQLVEKGRDEGAQSKPRIQDLLVDLISSLCGRTIEKQEYTARRRSFDDQELGQFAEQFRSSHELFVSWAPQSPQPSQSEWFRVVRKRLEEFGPRNTFPYDLPTVARLVQAYRVPAPRRLASSRRYPVRKSSTGERRGT